MEKCETIFSLSRHESLVNLGFCYTYHFFSLYSTHSPTFCPPPYPGAAIEFGGIWYVTCTKIRVWYKIEVWIMLLTFLSFHRFVTDFMFTMPFAASVYLLLLTRHSSISFFAPCIALFLSTIQMFFELNQVWPQHIDKSQPASSCQKAFART